MGLLHPGVGRQEADHAERRVFVARWRVLEHGSPHHQGPAEHPRHWCARWGNRVARHRQTEHPHQALLTQGGPLVLAPRAPQRLDYLRPPSPRRPHCDRLGGLVTQGVGSPLRSADRPAPAARRAQPRGRPTSPRSVWWSRPWRDPASQGGRTRPRPAAQLPRRTHAAPSAATAAAATTTTATGPRSGPTRGVPGVPKLSAWCAIPSRTVPTRRPTAHAARLCRRATRCPRQASAWLSAWRPQPAAALATAARRAAAPNVRSPAATAARGWCAAGLRAAGAGHAARARPAAGLWTAAARGVPTSPGTAGWAAAAWRVPHAAVPAKLSGRAAARLSAPAAPCPAQLPCAATVT
mmetsp:Transcript_516/g.1526  ORF Transcript_516/g.1526 Transcript_516/m.1526 type:complete len:352 (-) Transcript_516:773-1828(-)